MGAVSALADAADAVRRNPSILAVAGLYGLLGVPASVLTATPARATAGTAWSALVLLVVPFYLGGIVAMSADALNGDASVRGFLAAGRRSYRRLLPVVLAALAGAVALAVVVGVVAAVAIVVVGVSRAAALAVGGVAGLGLLALGLVAFFFAQFYPQVVVVDDAGVRDGLRGSARVVRRNLASVLGYTAVFLVGSTAYGVLTALAGLVVAPPTLPRIAAYALVTVVLAAVVGGYLSVYAVAFYRDIADSDRAVRRVTSE